MKSLGSEYEVVSHTGNSSVIGDPDRVWKLKEHEKPMLVVEMKTPWAFNKVGIIDEYHLEAEKFFAGKLKERGKVMRAVEQLYWYMVINNCRYGCLSTLDRTWFIRRVVSDHPPQSCLEISPCIPIYQTNPFTISSAWIYILLQLEDP